MGSAQGYRCPACGYRSAHVTADFGCGFSGVVVTPVLCEEHGIVGVSTGLNAMNPGWRSNVQDHYPCPECGAVSPLWDRRTCPSCGKQSMEADPEAELLMWD